MNEKNIIRLVNLSLSGNYAIDKNGLLIQDYDCIAYLINGFQLQGEAIFRL